MSQEKVREILSHVDMTKIDLTSFRISEKKFNALATIYRNRLITSCVGIMLDHSNCSKEEIDGAFSILKELIADKDKYDYDHTYTQYRQAVDKVLNDITTERNRSINDVKMKSIDKWMKDKYKHMHTTISAALDQGITFEDEFNEEFVEKCLTFARNAIESGERKAREAEQRTTPVSEEPKVSEPEVITEDDVALEEKPNVAPTPKKSFWERIRNKKKANV